MVELNLEAADFSDLTLFDVEDCVSITSVSLKSAVLNQTSLAGLLDSGDYCDFFGCYTFTGIGELDGITAMDLSGVDLRWKLDFRKRGGHIDR